jgi:hypothetical protein
VGGNIRITTNVSRNTVIELVYRQHIGAYGRYMVHGLTCMQSQTYVSKADRGTCYVSTRVDIHGNQSLKYDFHGTERFMKLSFTVDCCNMEEADLLVP